MKLTSAIACAVFAAFVYSCAAPPLRPSISKPMSTIDANAHLQTLWNAVEKPSGSANAPVMWNMATTPVLPTSWPPTADTVWVRYAYAQGMDMRLADGVYIAAPWAKVELRKRGTQATVVQLATKLTDNGVQGMVPLTPEQFEVMRATDARQAYALGLTALPNLTDKDAADMKAFYSAWLQANGRIARIVEADHGVFFAWING